MGLMMRDRWSYTFAPAKGNTGLNFGHARAYFDRIVATLADGEVVDLTLAEHVEKRSGRANRFLWGPLYDEAMEVILSKEGYRRDEWPQMKLLMHEGLTGKYQGYVTCPVTKQQVRKFQSSKATSKEFHAYIEWLVQMVAEDYGVALALPGDAA